MLTKLALAGVAMSYWFYMVSPAIPAAFRARFSFIYTLLDNKYYFDKFNDWFFAGGARLIGRGLWKGGDEGLIDGVLINGSANAVGGIAIFSDPQNAGERAPWYLINSEKMRFAC